MVASKIDSNDATDVSELSVDGSTEIVGPWLAIDYGQKRVGVAVSDEAGRLAMPLCTVVRKSHRGLIEDLSRLIQREAAKGLVVGEPRRLDGSLGDAAKQARRFASALARATQLPYVLVNEALTSRAAEERLHAAGVNPRRHPERIDQVAAQIILEEFLDRRSNRGAETHS